VQDGVTGLLVPPQDSGALANALLRLLRDPQLLQQIASAGRRLVSEGFSFERLVRETDELYTELLRRKGRH
jgi:glycosyltransferase involved in cell wall biosynthesis